MSKIHEALKKAAGGADDTVKTPDAALAETPQVTKVTAPITDEKPGQDVAVSAGELPPIPFAKLRAYRLQAHRHVVAHHTPKSLSAEQFRTLRTRIQRLTDEKASKVLLITSPEPGEGKTLVSTNLAVSFSHKVDHRVLLVGCDLRRPSLHTFMGMEDENQPGLSEYLSDQVPLEKVIWRLAGTSLFVICGGTTPDNPSELLGSRRMARTIEYLAGQFDQVVLDAPPLNPVADPTILIPLADGVLTVVRYGQTGREALRKALAAIPREKSLGLVFNAAELKLSGYYYSNEYELEQ